ncbi:MAG: RNA polymerase sigma-70 factor [Tannerellaceae bacterium]|nr:RNA polymerase sigma-70 factor [Tannerellaceae bacterium]
MENSADLLQFNKLVSDYYERFVRLAKTYVREPSVAEDITTDSFMYYWTRRHELEKESNVPAYILTVIKHKCLNYLQHVEVKETVAEQLKRHAEWDFRTRIATLEAFEPYELFTREVQTIIDKALAGLKGQTREIFIMSRYRQMSHKEIAARLDISTKSVEFHITKTLKLLRKELKDYLPAIPFFFY